VAGNSSGEAEEFEFDCPECGHRIKGEVSKCPKCGVEFIIEEVTEITCPACGETISASATSCPKCKTEFVIEQEAVVSKPAEKPPAPEPAKAAPQVDVEGLRKRFPELVTEIKPLLALAKEYNIDTAEARRLIDKSVRSGKQGDVAAAVEHALQCKASILTAINGRLDSDLDHLEKLVEVAKFMSSNPAAISDSIKAVKDRRSLGDLEGALKEAMAGKRQAEKLTGKYIEASELCDALNKLINSCERFYVDVREAKKLLAEAKDAGDHGDWSMMGILARKGRDEILKTLPDLLTAELKKAKSMLLDAKAEGKDVAMLVKLLKESGTAFKQEKYEEALDCLIEFKSEVKHL
jgi:DNA-directed RNA polymerase subunit RPC12/RpoP